MVVNVVSDGQRLGGGGGSFRFEIVREKHGTSSWFLGASGHTHIYFLSIRARIREMIDFYK